MIENKQITLAERPKGMPNSNTFKIKSENIKGITEGQILVKTLYVSVDPYMRGRMDDSESYVAPFKINHVIEGGVVGEVIESKSASYSQGDIVLGSYGWQEYYVATDKELRKIDTSLAPITTHLGILGMTGLTAYFGLLEIGKPVKGETVVVSGAAGAVAQPPAPHRPGGSE